MRGRADIGLDIEGRDQAWATARRISATERVKTVYTSPLKRALETARILAGIDRTSITIAEGLTDIDYGKWQGLTLEEARQDDSRVYNLWLSEPHLTIFPGGEGLENVRDRALGVLHDVVKAHPGETVLLVSHKVVCKVLVCTVLGLHLKHFWQFDQDVCAIDRLEGNNRGIVAVKLNDTCHLKGLF